MWRHAVKREEKKISKKLSSGEAENEMEELNGRDTYQTTATQSAEGHVLWIILNKVAHFVDFWMVVVGKEEERKRGYSKSVDVRSGIRKYRPMLEFEMSFLIHVSDIEIQVSEYLWVDHRSLQRHSLENC